MEESGGVRGRIDRRGGGQRLKAIVGRQMKTLSHPFLFC